MCYHSEQASAPAEARILGFEAAYPAASARTAASEARILADLKAAERSDLIRRVRDIAELPGPKTPKEVRELAAACVKDMQLPPGRALDLDGIMRMYKRFRDLIAELYLPGPQAEMIRASLTVSEMQGLDMEAPVCCRTCVGTDGRGIPCDYCPAVDVPYCAGHGDIRERRFEAGHYCPSCGRKAD